MSKPEFSWEDPLLLDGQLSEEERAAYDAVLAATRDDVAKRLGAGAGAIQILEALLRLRQAACHPSLLPGADARASSSKLDLLLERLDEALAGDAALRRSVGVVGKAVGTHGRQSRSEHAKRAGCRDAWVSARGAPDVCPKRRTRQARIEAGRWA